MKVASKLVLLSLGLFAALSANAETYEQSYINACRKDAGVPVPIEVVSPKVSTETLGAKVELEFVVEQSGRPVEVSVKSSTDATVAEAVVEAVKQWKFKPAKRDGVPVATKVLLPVNVVERTDPGFVLAAN